jgi:glycerophosphoryl diester phosphodiesterase
MGRLSADSWINNQFIAHRGFHNREDAPENSSKAFQRACEQGFAIELDVHIIKDGTLIVFHDNDLYRMTGVNKNVKDCKVDEISSLKLGKSNERIPLFVDVLKLIDGKVPLMIELKNKENNSRLEKALYSELKKYKGDYAIQSFNPFSVAWFRFHAKYVIRGQLSGNYNNEKMFFLNKFLLENLLLNIISKPDFVNYEIAYLNKYAIRRLKAKQMPILGWTARDKETFELSMQKCNNVVFEGFLPDTYKTKE